MSKSDTKIGLIYPKIKPAQAENIPELLKSVKQWIVWRAGPIKENGKFDKIPTHPKTGRNINHLDESNWQFFNDAFAAYQSGIGSGVGFVLSSNHKVTIDNVEYCIVAVDLDGVTGERVTLAREVGMKLGRPYLEISPSGKGVRLFALSTKPISGGNAGEGRELYCDKRFVTVTGNRGIGKVKDATAGILTLDREWFPKKSEPEIFTNDFGLGYNLGREKPPETEHEIARVKDALAYISPDINRNLWRDIIWSVMSTGWACAENLVREWSMTVDGIENAQHVYEEDAFAQLVNDFDPTRGMGIRTLYHHAKEAGWPGYLIKVADRDPGAASRRLLTAEEVKSIPNAPYRVRGLLPAQGVATIFGESGAGKSFVAMDITFAIAAGRAEWFGMRVRQAPVCWIALEGQSGLKRRLAAWEIEYSQPVPQDVRFMVSGLSLKSADDVIWLAKELTSMKFGSEPVIVIDTLAQSAAGFDENSPQDMGAVIGNAQLLANKTGGLILLVHHTGKDKSRGPRGHSSLIGAVDAAVQIVRDKAERYLSIYKAKDDEDSLRLDFDLTVHVVGKDDDGEDITSCAVRRALPSAKTSAKPVTGKNQIAGLKVLTSMLVMEPGGVDLGAAIEEVSRVLVCDKKRRRYVATETIKSLASAGHIFFNENERVVRPASP